MSQKNSVVRIKLESEYCDKVNEFANEMAEKGDFRSDFEGSAIPRSKSEIKRDAIEGKYAEYAFYQYIEGVDDWTTDPPDLGVWDRGIWDAGDFEVRRGDKRRQIEIKSSSMKSRCILLPADSMTLKDDKVYFYDEKDQTDKNCPDCVVGARVDLENRTVELAGALRRQDLREAMKDPKDYLWKHGEPIPGTSVPFRVDNYVWVYPQLAEKVSGRSSRPAKETLPFIDKRK